MQRSPAGDLADFSKTLGSTSAPSEVTRTFQLT